MRLGTIMLALTASAVPAQGAFAQLAPGVSGSSTTSYMNADETWRTLRSFGVCFAKVNETGAWALIATEPDSEDEAAVYKKMARGGGQPCLSDTTLRAPLTFIRGAIAEGLYKRGVTVPPELLLAPPASGATIRTLGEATRCFAAAHRDEMRALLADTIPGSKKESAALSAMAPAFYQCLPPAAQERSFNPTQIRFRLAEALLRMPAPATVPSMEGQ